MVEPVFFGWPFAEARVACSPTGCMGHFRVRVGSRNRVFLGFPWVFLQSLTVVAVIAVGWRLNQCGNSGCHQGPATTGEPRCHHPAKLRRSRRCRCRAEPGRIPPPVLAGTRGTGSLRGGQGTGVDNLDGRLRGCLAPDNLRWHKAVRMWPVVPVVQSSGRRGAFVRFAGAVNAEKNAAVTELTARITTLETDVAAAGAAGTGPGRGAGSGQGSVSGSHPAGRGRGAFGHPAAGTRCAAGPHRAGNPRPGMSRRRARPVARRLSPLSPGTSRPLTPEPGPGPGADSHP
jgi:hypothetical protein